MRLLLLAGLAVAVLAAPGHAAPLSYADPAGDSLGGQPGLDIVSVSYATTGRGSGRAHVPENVVVTVRAAGPIVQLPGATYRVESESERCGHLAFLYGHFSAEGPTGRIYTLCGPDDKGAPVRVFDVGAVVSGNTITFTAPLARLGGAIVRGDQWRALRSYAGLEDPYVLLFGLGHVEVGGHGTFLDVAETSRSWTVG